MSSMLFLIILSVQVVLGEILPNLGNKFFTNSLHDTHLLFERNSDNLVLLYNYNHYVLLGGRNAVYNVSLSGEKEVSKYEWFTSDKSRRECEKILQIDCDNFIRTYYPLRNSFVICGTHGLQPTCAEFSYQSKAILKTFSGRGLSPFVPDQSAPFLFTNDSLYTVNGVEYSSSSDTILLRKNIRKNGVLRTARRESPFDNAVFVDIEQHNKEIFTFFTEVPSVISGEGLRRVARIGRVCSDDPGAERYSDEWSSFLKATLECGISEEGLDTLHFNQIMAIASTSQLFFGAFRSHLSGLGRSALCIIDKHRISNLFGSYLKSGEGECKRATNRDEQTFIRNNPLIKQRIVTAPNFVYYEEDHFTSILVQENATDLLNNLYNIVYLGTNTGRVLKVVTDSTTNISVHVATFQPFKRNELITSLFLDTTHFSNNRQFTWLVLMTHNKVARIPNAGCNTATSCIDCLRLRDPHCAWILNGAECVPTEQNIRRSRYLTQDIAKCPPREQQQTTLLGDEQVPCNPNVKSETYEGNARTSTSAVMESLVSLSSIFFFSTGLAIGAILNCLLARSSPIKESRRAGRIDAFTPSTTNSPMGCHSDAQTYC